MFVPDFSSTKGTSAPHFLTEMSEIDLPKNVAAGIVLF
jgi:hypothetical protein